MADAYITVTDASLEAMGAESLFNLYRDRIARTLAEQEQGTRAAGDIEFTIKVKIGLREEGIRYHATAGLKEPGYTSKAAIGSLARSISVVPARA